MTRTGTGDSAAASVADSKVPDSAAERWIETISVAPAARPAAGRRPSKSAGDGCDVFGSIGDAGELLVELQRA